MLNYAASLKVPWIAKLPPFRKPKIIVLWRDYRYLRNADEIDRFLRAAREEDEVVYMVFLLAVYTGTLGYGEIEDVAPVPWRRRRAPTSAGR